MSEITRINPHYVVALERNGWDDLPAPVFVRGFVVQICRILGLDEKKTVDSFMRIYKAGLKKEK
jgi:cytoskeletal protein RodZ